MLLLIALMLAPQYTETIVVTAERIEQPSRESAAAITVLSGEELRRTPAQNLGDALRLVPGLQIIAVNPGAPPMVLSRGFFGAGEVEYVQLLIDGVPAGDVESGLGDWRSIPIEEIDHIEIVRGPGSSLFGDVALGGVVQVFRRRAPHALVSAGSFGTRRASAGIAHASASFVRSDGFRTHSASEELFANVAYGGFSLDAAHRDREDPGSQDPDGNDSELFREDREESRRVRAAYRYRGAFDALVHATDRHSDMTRTLLLAPGFGDRATRVVDTFAIGGNVTKTFDNVIGGVELAHASLDSRYAEVRGSGSRRLGAAFASGEWRVTPSLRLAAGARYDAISDSFEGEDVTDRAFSPRIAMSFEAGPVAAYVQLARAFKAPTLDQRFDQRPIAGFTVSNPALSPQRAKNYEAGVRGANWEAVAYLMDVEDEIDFDVRTFRYGNIGRSRHRGVETSWRGRFASLGYTWTRVAGEDGHQLKNIAEHVVRGALDFADLQIATLHIGVEHSAGRWLDDANQFPLDDATVVDVRIAKTIRSITAAIEANNLFDTRYAPIGFLVGDAPYTYPGAGRSIALTLSWKGARDHEH